MRFGVVGIGSTAIDFLVYNALLGGGLGVYLAGGLGFMAGFVNGYFWNSRAVFKKSSPERAARYLLVSLGGLLLTELFLHFFHVQLGWSENVAKLGAVGIVFFWNYLLSSRWAFR